MGWLNKDERRTDVQFGFTLPQPPQILTRELLDDAIATLNAIGANQTNRLFYGDDSPPMKTVDEDLAAPGPCPPEFRLYSRWHVAWGENGIAQACQPRAPLTRRQRVKLWLRLRRWSIKDRLVRSLLALSDRAEGLARRINSLAWRIDDAD